jgi:hypothetical protein
MVVEGPEKHFVSIERNPCVAPNFNGDPCLVISRLGKVIKTMSNINLLPLDISLAYLP